MKIISFAWTSEALLKKKKTVTRRTWKNKYASQFKVGDRCVAYNKNPRLGGKPIAIIQITDIYKEKLKDMPVSDLKNEGGLWKTKKEFIELFDSPEQVVWVIRFEVARILKGK